MTDDDATTEADLRALFAHVDPVPPLLDDAARAAFTWRTIDAELAELMRDSADASEEAALLVRSGGGPRQAELRVAAARDRARGRPRPATARAAWRASCCRPRRRW